MPAMPTLPTIPADGASVEDLQTALAGTRTALIDGARTLVELRTTPADKRGDTFKVDAAEAVDFLHNADLVEKILAGALERAAQPDGQDEQGDPHRGARGPRGAFAGGEEAEHRTIGQQFVEQDGYKGWVERGGRSSGIYGGEVRNLIGEFSSGIYDSGADGWLPVATPQMVVGSQQRRRAFVRDLMSVQSTGLKVVPYIRETNQLTNESGAQMTSEGSAKAEVTMTFEQYSAIVEKITAWLPATDEIMTDAPTLRGYIDTRLEYMLMIREEQQVLAGSGASPQLPGLSSLSGSVQTQSEITDDYPATIGAAIGKVENVDGEADGVVTNALDYWAAVIQRHATQFDHGFGGNAPATLAGITWGLPAVRTRAMTSGKAWVGSWRLGSTLFDRQQTTIRVGDQHSDYLIRNLIVILAEKRIAVAWHRPNLFVDTTVPQPA